MTHEAAVTRTLSINRIRDQGLPTALWGGASRPFAADASPGGSRGQQPARSPKWMTSAPEQTRSPCCIPAGADGPALSERTPTGARGKVPRGRSSQQWRWRRNGGQPGPRDGSGFGRRMILILAGGPRAEGGGAGRANRATGEAEPAVGATGQQVGQPAGSDRAAASPQEAEPGNRGGNRRTQTDRPPGRKLRRAMTWVETKANARRSIDGGSRRYGVFNKW